MADLQLAHVRPFVKRHTPPPQSLREHPEGVPPTTGEGRQEEAMPTFDSGVLAELRQFQGKTEQEYERVCQTLASEGAQSHVKRR